MNFRGERPTKPEAPAVHTAVPETALETARRNEFLRLLNPLLGPARNLAGRLLGTRQHALDDVMQEALIKATLNFEKATFPNERTLYAWFAKIVTNCAIDNQRRARLREHTSLEHLTEMGVPLAEVPEEDAPKSPEELVALVQQNERIRKAMEHVPPEQLVVFNLVYVEGLSYSEAAEHLGIPVGTVMSRLSRGRKNILQALAERTPDILEAEASVRTRTAVLKNGGINKFKT